MTKVPDRTGDYTWNAAFRNSPQRGAMPITHFDLDGQAIASYYDRHPELVPLVSPPQSEEAKA